MKNIKDYEYIFAEQRIAWLDQKTKVLHLVSDKCSPAKAEEIERDIATDFGNDYLEEIVWEKGEDE